jgi:STE24 endopeptidase
MNIYALIILVTLILSFLLSLITNILNLKHLSPVLPKEFEGTYDAEAYKNSQEYTRVYTRFGFLTGSISLIITLVFWFAGGFNYLDTFVRSWDLGAIGNGLIYIAILVQNDNKDIFSGYY